MLADYPTLGDQENAMLLSISFFEKNLYLRCTVG